MTRARDTYAERLDSRRVIEEEETTANGAAGLQVLETVDEVKQQDNVVRGEKTRPALKPKPTSDNKREEQNEIVELPEGTVVESPAITVHHSPSDEVKSGEQQVVIEVENTTVTGRNSPGFVPDTNGSPQTVRLPRVCDSFKDSPTASPSHNRRSYHKSQSEPLGNETRSTTSSKVTGKSLSVQSSPQATRSRTTSPESGNQTPRSLSQKNSPVPWAGNVSPTRSHSRKTSTEAGSVTPTAQGSGSSPTTKSRTGSVCSSTNATPKLPRLAFDHATVTKMLDDSKRHRRAASEKVHMDFGSPTKAEKKLRRNSWDNHFHGHLNALLDPSAGKSKDLGTDFPPASPKQFLTPQPRRKGYGSQTSTPSIIRRK